SDDCILFNNKSGSMGFMPSFLSIVRRGPDVWIFFIKDATLSEHISSRFSSRPFFQCCAVTTSPVSILFVQTSLGTIPSADNAARKGLALRFGNTFLPPCSAL